MVDRARRKIIRRIFCLTVVLLWAIAPKVTLCHEPQRPAQWKITALYLYNFLLFVDWPEEAFSKSKTMRVSIIGEPNLYEAMKSMSGKMIKGKRLEICSMGRPGEVDESSLVIFVGEKGKDGLKELLKRFSNRPVLTVSNSAGFVDLGGMVFLRDPEVPRKSKGAQKRFVINLPAVKDSGLRIRSRLLRMSDILYEEEPGAGIGGKGQHQP